MFTLQPLKILVLGAGNRGNAYSEYSLYHPNELKIIGVAEPRAVYRKAFVKRFNITDRFTFKTWQNALANDRCADAVIVATQDQMHFHPAIQAMEKGYDVLVEKPMAMSPEECQKMVAISKKHKRVFGVCHILRYTHFYKKLKEVIDSGIIGHIVTVEHLEPVRFWHQAHSFVRGNWRNSRESSPMILAKAGHDMDILRWLIGKPCKRISSFGSLHHFKKENAPKGSTDYCINGCRIEPECPYSAIKLYLNPYVNGWPVDVITSDLSMEGRIKAIKDGPYGRCVYRCDNDVVDHQVVSMEFEGGITASFTMTAFTGAGTERRTRVMGTLGEILGDFRYIRVTTFIDSQTTVYNTNTESDDVVGIGQGAVDAKSGHGGGDAGLMHDFIHAVREKDPSHLSSSIEDSLESHLICFAAEDSRLNGRIISLVV